MRKKLILTLILFTILGLITISSTHIPQLYSTQYTNYQNSYSYQITDWWNYDFTIRHPINLNTSVTSIPQNYQIHMNLTYRTDMKTDFSDIRFISYSDNTTQLSYWIENQSNNQWCNLWIKIPETITMTNTTHLWLYYDNPTANNASNGHTTFDFFDDFNTDLSQWTKHKTQGIYPQIDNNTLLLGGGTTSSPYGHTIIGSNASYTTFQNGIIETDIYPSTNALPEITFRGNYSNNTGNKGRWDCRSGTESPWMKPPYTGWSSFGTAVTRFGIPNQWQKIKLEINNTTYQIYNNGNLKSSVTDSEYFWPGEIALMNHYGNYVRYDNIRVRKYTSDLPTTYIGPEQIA